MKLQQESSMCLSSKEIATALMVAVVSSGALFAESNNDVFDPGLYRALEYRLLGPFRGGRVTAVEGVAGQPFTFYMGATGGGVWRSTNAGQDWANISDGYFETGSIGAIDVADSLPPFLDEILRS